MKISFQQEFKFPAMTSNLIKLIDLEREGERERSKKSVSLSSLNGA
jgi:hypothetical protein